MNFNFYYRGLDKKLHHLLVSEGDSLEVARGEVSEFLLKTQEKYLKPLLCLFKSDNSSTNDAQKEEAA